MNVGDTTWRCWVHGDQAPYYEAWKVSRLTPRGYWVQFGVDGGDDRTYWQRHWICNDGTRRWAWPTKREAVDSLVRRRRRQIRILEAKLSIAEDELRRAGVELDRQIQGPALLEAPRDPAWMTDVGKEFGT